MVELFVGESGTHIFQFEDVVNVGTHSQELSLQVLPANVAQSCTFTSRQSHHKTGKGPLYLPDPVLQDLLDLFPPAKTKRGCL